MTENISKLLEDWYARPSGQLAFQKIDEIAGKSLEHIFGYYLIQLGLARNMPLYHQSTIPTRVLLSNRSGELIKLIASFEELPIDSDSTDAVIGHHFLEFSKQPHKTLREIHRVLTPQGHLILIGFNPYSLFGLGQLGLKLSGVRLWKSWSPISGARLKDWLHLLGFEIVSYDTICHIPEFSSGKIRNLLIKLDNIARESKLPAGGLFVIHAIKSVAGASAIVRKKARHKTLPGIRAPAPSVGAIVPSERYCPRKLN
tara:strand:- start:1037 stop:1807 length:771 start_codon:yes stop_codon:yes gene_type:complete